MGYGKPSIFVRKLSFPSLKLTLLDRYLSLLGSYPVPKFILFLRFSAIEKKDLQKAIDILLFSETK